MTIKTRNHIASGTQSVVTVQVFGEDDTHSDFFVIDGSDAMLGLGQTETRTVLLLESIVEPTSVRLSIDGTGPYPAWNVHWVELQCNACSDLEVERNKLFLGVIFYFTVCRLSSIFSQNRVFHFERPSSFVFVNTTQVCQED